MNIFKTCQPDNYSSDYIKIKKERAKKKDINIITREKTKRRVKNDLPFDINVNNKSNIDYKKSNIKAINDTNIITGITYIDPENKLFNTNCHFKYLQYIDASKNCL